MLSYVQVFCDLLDYSPPDSFVHGISQLRILEWVAISFSRAFPVWAGGFFTTEPLSIYKYKKCIRGLFPGGSVVKNLPANAGDKHLIPDLGGFHVPQGNWARVTQLLSPCALEPMLCNREATAVRNPHPATKGRPHLAQLKARCNNADPSFLLPRKNNK